MVNETVYNVGRSRQLLHIVLRDGATGAHRQSQRNRNDSILQHPHPSKSSMIGTSTIADPRQQKGSRTGTLRFFPCALG
jgi:hypothetical protein